MKKHKILIIILTIVLVVYCIVIAYLNSNYHYSKLLLNAIIDENELQVREILEKKPKCVNVYPTLASEGWQSLMDQSIGYPLVEACYTGNIEIIKLLVENGADVNLGARFTPLSFTYNQKPQNWYSISIYLLENGASLDYKTHYAYGNVLIDIVEGRPGSMSVKYGIENNEEVIKAFRYALENCDHSNVNWMRVLQHSVTNDRIEIVKFLLDEKYCEVNDNSVEMTALMFAARDSTPEMIQLLLDYGADKNCKSNEGKTAYDYAVEFDRKDNIPLLEN